ncbi:MAG: 16S rRNA (uracil(1498)-N(3))-methyltransferase [Acidobacteriota bacterium]|nr:16S rRNA (uracil(1498)-N(3))-methyltransferase [Acidobacteriota bacterium]
MTRRRWIADKWDDETATLTGSQAAHLARVLRAERGMKADVVAGGRLFHSTVDEVRQDDNGEMEVRFALLDEASAESALPITLVMAVYKFDRMEWAIEKATELGVAAIAPVIARRSEKHLAQSAAKRAERWRRIAREAAQQSRRSDVPEIHDPVVLKERMQLEMNAVRIVLAEQERATMLHETVQGAIQDHESTPAFEIAVGPEGGWAPEEAKMFEANGWKAVSLGSRILRAETAAIAALAVTASLLE